MKPTNSLFLLAFFLVLSLSAFSQSKKLELLDIFDLEYISSPSISPAGDQVIYVRNFKDIMADANRSNLWITNVDGSNNRPLTTGNQNDRSPAWSPDGKKIIYLSNQAGGTQMYLRWLEDGTEQKLSNFPKSPGNIRWSPDGKWIAFTMSVDGSPSSLVQLPKGPKGAKWTASPVYIDKLNYKADGAGFLPAAFTHIFLLNNPCRFSTLILLIFSVLHFVLD